MLTAWLQFEINGVDDFLSGKSISRIRQRAPVSGALHVCTMVN
ncbi:MAG: hypothetical protein N6V49_00640 [Serratia symbiotica]|nr:hypothetical protein [Serratia symbiotica]